MARTDPSDIRNTLLFQLGPSEIEYAINSPYFLENPEALPVSIIEMFADPAEAGAIQQYRLLSTQLAASANNLAQQNMLALERHFPHLNLPQILQIAGPVFPNFHTLTHKLAHSSA